jgi:hypothetical protein
MVVVGGGSAGWITAAVLAAEHRELKISLIESPDRPAIGVGEGTWPSMRSTLHRIGLPEIDLIRECDASFKQGSRFDGWIRGAAGAEGDRYYHPFSLPQGYGEVELIGAWQHGHAQHPYADTVTPQVQLCEHGLAPKQVTTPGYAGAVNYGYHFDAVKLGQVLQRHATTKLGVHHILAEIESVRSHENGDIAALRTRELGDIEGDLFVDCSGMSALLIGQHYGVAFRSEKGVLFNDTAMAVQVPYEDPATPLASATIATAHAEGWTWDIGLPTRRGVGLVFSSAHSSDEAAERTLRAYLQRTGSPAEVASPRKISFNPGYREHFWHRNCVAIGLSAGFIEPLEASALALVELSAAMLRDEMPVDRADMALVAKRFNEAFAYRWARIIDFLKLHYVLSQREDSDYWRAHRRADTQPESLRELLQIWRHRPPSRVDFYRIEEVFPAASYQYVLYGMGFKPASSRTARPEQLAAAEAAFKDVSTLTRRLMSGLPRHRDLLQHLHTHGMPSA